MRRPPRRPHGDVDRSSTKPVPLTVAVHGLGYVGAVTSACLAEQGHQVIAVDIDRAKVDQINRGIATVVEPKLSEIVARTTSAGRLRARHHCQRTTDRLAAIADVHLVCVGTPSSASGTPDTSAVTTVVSDIVAAMAAGSMQQTAFPVIVVRSTILPGTIESLAALLESRYHLEVGADFGLAMCPEFLREASAVADFFAPPFTVAGVNDDRSRAVMESLFAFIDAPFHPVAVPTAETIKYACNAFHAMKVAFANEVARFAQATGGHGPTVMDVFCQDHQLNVSEAYLRPGFAFGGSCLPKDLRALVQCGRELGLDLPLLSSVLPSNEQHLDHTLRLILSHGPRRVGLLGLTFKTGTDDLRESPFVRVAETLIGKGIDVSIWDPDLNPVRLRGGNLRFADDRLPHLGRLLEASPVDALAGADLALVGTDHPDAVAALALGPPIPVIDDASSLAAGPAERSHEFARVMS